MRTRDSHYIRQWPLGEWTSTLPTIPPPVTNTNTPPHTHTQNSDLEVLKLRQKVSELKEIHQRLYTLAVDKPLETLQEQ